MCVRINPNTKSEYRKYSMQKITVNRRETKFSSDPSRVINKFYYPGNEKRAKNIINRVLTLSEDRVLISIG